MSEMGFIYIYKNDGISSHKKLCRAFMRYADMNHIRIDDKALEIVRDRYGKPSFLHYPRIHFSIAHTKQLWACAFFEEKIGLDIENEKNVDHHKIAKRFFHPQEAAFIHDSFSFYRLWTAKESYVKYIGRGIDEHFSKISVLPGHKEMIDRKEELSWKQAGVFFHSLILEDGSFLCVCTAKQVKLKINETEVRM